MTKIFAALFVIFFIIPFLLRAVLSILFGAHSRKNRSSQSNRNASASSSSSNMQRPASKKKVISKNEGEYVDYEVIKD